MDNVISVLGWILFTGGALAGIAANLTDRKLQGFRRPDVPDSSYWFVPIRIRRDLYQPEGHYLVTRAWGLIGAMYGLALLGMLLITAGR